MESLSEYYFELIAKYFSGEASEEEMEFLSVWINESTENSILFNNYSKTWHLISKAKVESKMNIDYEWKNCESKIDFSLNDKIKSIRTTNQKSLKFLKLAASIALIIITSYLFFFYSGNSVKKQLVAQNKAIDVVLPDKSQITLNTGIIEYQEDFEKREVSLNGKAFFNIVHDDQKTFSIKTGDIIIEDIGTSFYINTHSFDNKVIVILKEGKVALYKKDKPTEKYFLEPGEKAEYSLTEKTFTTSINNDNNYIAWKTKELIFNDNTLYEIVPLLNEVYRSNISFKSNDIKNCKLTAEFKNQSLESVLKVLKETLNLTITKSDTGIELSGNGCK